MERNERRRGLNIQIHPATLLVLLLLVVFGYFLFENYQEISSSFKSLDFQNCLASFDRLNFSDKSDEACQSLQKCISEQNSSAIHWIIKLLKLPIEDSQFLYWSIGILAGILYLYKQ